MAKSLMGGREPPETTPRPQTNKETGLPENLDPAMLGRLTKMMRGGGNDEKRALLEAMMPYLSPVRREKLERAMKLAKMIGMAELAFGVLGGDDAKI